jgi:hypothetical protein
MNQLLMKFGMNQSLMKFGTMHLQFSKFFFSAVVK